jgi:pimeloyl-ACP methyl ester carboxylesterase
VSVTGSPYRRDGLGQNGGLARDLIRCLLFSTALAGCSLVGSLGKEDCPEGFECHILEAPLAHDDPSVEGTIEVVFAVRPADGRRLGVLVTAVGGPGASGLESAALAPESMDPAILENFDLVYFDQRGLRSFPDAACPIADAAYGDSYVALPAGDPPRWEGLIELSEDYNQSCIAESEALPVIPHLGTAEVVGDLEMFRREQGYDSLVIYGESYGTVVAQRYASRYPDRVERLILDGPVDLTRDSLQQADDQIQGLDEVTASMFDACDADVHCSTDMGRPAVEAYRSLVAQLLETPESVRFPVAPGKFEETPLLAEDVTYLAFANSYFEGDRMIFLRALASAMRGEYVPMLRLYSSADFGISSIVNQSVSCLDGSLPGGDPTAELEAVTGAREAAPPELRWFYESALACVHWPAGDRTLAPVAPTVAGAIPVLVIAAEADAATPAHRAVDMLAQFDDSRLLLVEGGSHVMFGRGNACVDDHVTSFILGTDGSPRAECEAAVIEPYVRLISPGAGPDELLTGIDNELFYLPEMLYWDGYSTLEVPCTLGGTVTFTGSDLTTDFRLDKCAFTPDLVVDGEGRWDYEHGRSDLMATIDADQCVYDFRQLWGDEIGRAEADCP